MTATLVLPFGDSAIPPLRSSSNSNPDESFERSCVRVLNRVWVPSLSFSRLERLFQDECPGSTLSYSWYRQHILFSNLEVPDLSFIPLKSVWETNLHELLRHGITKLNVYRRWEEFPSSGLVFPLIGSPSILFESLSAPEFNSVMEFDRVAGRFLVIALLKDYATLFKEGVFHE